MPLHSNKGELSAAQKLDYLIFWFREFSDMQKGDFLEILARKYNDQIEESSTLSALQRISLQDRPSIFSCRMNLFDKWFIEWNEEQRQELITRMRHLDSDFVEKFDIAVQTGQLPTNALQYSSYEISDELFDKLRRENESMTSQSSVNSISNVEAHTSEPLSEQVNGHTSGPTVTHSNGNRTAESEFDEEAESDDSELLVTNGVHLNGIDSSHFANGHTENGFSEVSTVACE